MEVLVSFDGERTWYMTYSLSVSYATALSVWVSGLGDLESLHMVVRYEELQLIYRYMTSEIST